MTIRTRSSTVTFRKPFLLEWINKELPAGKYEVVSEEEVIDGISFLAYRKLQTYIYRQSEAGRENMTRSYVVDLADLDAALARDEAAAQEDAEGDGVHETIDHVIEMGVDSSDRDALERASNDGIPVQPG